MSREVFTHLLPSLFDPEELRGGVAVVLDVLRASTTIVHALAAGALAVIPCGEVDEARQIAASFPAESRTLGGERGGCLIEGFHLDNSPLRYTETTVRGRTVLFTTTNGTRALLRSSQAERVLIGSFVNLSAVVDLLSTDDRPVHLVCAGTEGRITAEDCLCAGAIADELVRQSNRTSVNDDPTQMAIGFYCAEADHLADAMRRSRGGRNCAALGFDADIERAVTRDLFRLVPEFFPATGRIEAFEIPAPTAQSSATKGFTTEFTEFTEFTEDTESRTNRITEAIIDAAIQVHKTLGPGLLESAYQICLAHELRKRGLHVEREVPLPVQYDKARLDCGYRLDLLVEGVVIVEIKSVAELTSLHQAQLLSYLRLANRRIGLLINFNTRLLKDGIKRLVNDYNPHEQ